MNNCVNNMHRHTRGRMHAQATITKQKNMPLTAMLLDDKVYYGNRQCRLYCQFETS